VLQRDGGSSQGGMVYKAFLARARSPPIYAFGKPPEDASNPMFPLVEGKDGNLYGIRSSEAFRAPCVPRAAERSSGSHLRV